MTIDDQLRLNTVIQRYEIMHAENMINRPPTYDEIQNNFVKMKEKENLMNITTSE